MQAHGIKARGKRKFVVTTDSKHDLPVAPNLLARNFNPKAPDLVWIGDITYIATDEGWLYLAAVLDLFRRHPEPGLIFHSDRGSQYCSGKFQDALSSYGMCSSMSRKGHCWDNAPTESLWGSLKVGRLYGRRFATQREAMDEVIDWLTFYNHCRLHSTLGYINPMKFEENWRAGQVKKAA